jgi:hypothetical protein
MTVEIAIRTGLCACECGCAAARQCLACGYRSECGHATGCDAARHTETASYALNHAGRRRTPVRAPAGAGGGPATLPPVLASDEREPT